MRCRIEVAPSTWPGGTENLNRLSGSDSAIIHIRRPMVSMTAINDNFISTELAGLVRQLRAYDLNAIPLP